MDDQRCHLREESGGWVLAIDGVDRLALPTRDGAGSYLSRAPGRDLEIRVVVPFP